MPRATVIVTPVREYLTTLPAQGDEEAGWVELRRLSWGEKLQKDAEAMKMRFAADPNDPKKSMDAEVSMVSVNASMLEFARCIVDHNLDDGGMPDKDGNPTREPRKLDFRKPSDCQLLDGRVGEEISQLIGKLNDFEKQSTTSVMDAEGK